MPARLRQGGAPGSPGCILVERLQALVRCETPAPQERPPNVSPHAMRGILGRPGGAVPQVAVMQYHVPALSVDADLAGDLLEPERHAVDRTPMAAGHHPQEPVGRRGRIEVQRDGHTWPDVRRGPALMIAVPTNPRVRHALPRTGVLVDGAVPVVIPEVHLRPEHPGDELNDEGMMKRGVSRRRDLRD